MKIVIKNKKTYVEHDKQIMEISEFEKWVVIKKIIDTYKQKTGTYEYVYKETNGISKIESIKISEGTPFNKLQEWNNKLGYGIKIVEIKSKKAPKTK